MCVCVLLLLLFCFFLRVKLSLFPRIFRLNPFTSQSSIKLIVEIMKTECCVFLCVEIMKISGVCMCVCGNHENYYCVYVCVMIVSQQ